MNLTEIKNAQKWELYEYVKHEGYDVYPTDSKKKLRNCALELYWKMRENRGYSFENTRGGIY